MSGLGGAKITGGPKALTLEKLLRVDHVVIPRGTVPLSDLATGEPLTYAKIDTPMHKGAHEVCFPFPNGASELQLAAGRIPRDVFPDEDVTLLCHPDTAKALWPERAAEIDQALEQGDRDRYASAVRFWSGPLSPSTPDVLTICDCLPRQLACNLWTCDGCAPRRLFGFGGPW